MLGFGKKNKEPKYTDIEIVEGIQSEDEAEANKITNSFYLTCKKYFDERYEGVIDTKGHRAVEGEDIFHWSFQKLWEEIRIQKIRVADNRVCRVDSDHQLQPMTANLKTYLMGIVKNINFENVRKESKYADDLIGTGGTDIIDEVESHMEEEIVYKCVCELPPRCKDILTAFYYLGKSLEQILEERKENQSYDGLKSAKSKCMRQLKDNVIEEYKRNNLKRYA